MSIRSTGAVGSGRRRSNMPGPKEKSFAIPRLMVWEAWRRVRANKGAPGVDAVDLEEFEADLRDNLYKIWNRMSSGSYLPPAVRAVEIPKPHGDGVRMLGVPNDRGQGRADGSSHASGGTGGPSVSPGLLCPGSTVPRVFRSVEWPFLACQSGSAGRTARFS